jgi:hypothetical protein
MEAQGTTKGRYPSWRFTYDPVMSEVIDHPPFSGSLFREDIYSEDCADLKKNVLKFIGRSGLYEGFGHRRSRIYWITYG